MGNYAEQVTVADFGTRVAGVRAHLATWSDDHRHIVDREDGNILDRVDRLLDEVLVATSIQNEIVVPQGLVGSLTNAIVAVDAAVTALDAVDEHTVSMPLINDLSNAAETLAANLFQWPPRVDGDNWREAVTQAASTYRRSAGQQLAGLSAEIEAARAELGRIEQLSIDLANKTRELGDQVMRDLTEQLTSLQNQVTSTNATVAAAGTQVQAAVDRSEAAIGTQQQQFAEAQEARSKEFAASLKQLVIDADGLIEAASNDAQAKVDRIDELMAKTDVLVDVFTAAGTANAYSAEAEAQGARADRWRAIAIWLGVFTAIAAAYVLVEFPKTSIDTWQLVIGKVAVGLTVGAVAGYAASQSARHRRREERAKHLELNLETFGRLSSELGPENLEVARSALVDTMLKVDEAGSGGNPGKDSISDEQINVIGRLIDQIQKVRG